MQKKKNKILVYGASIVGDPFETLPYHTGQEPFIYLKNFFFKNGFTIELYAEEKLDQAAWILFWDMPGGYLAQSNPKIFRSFARRLLNCVRGIAIKSAFERVVESSKIMGLEDRLAIILWEPRSVLPQNYDLLAHKKFNKVFTWDDDLVDGNKYIKFCWPQNGNPPEYTDMCFDKRKLIVNISGNKFSVDQDELYSKRCSFIRYCEAKIPDQFDLYGHGWESDKNGAGYSSWRGVVSHKSDIYPKYKFGLTYENMCNVRGWVSEKIFDCIRCGVVPVYWGADNIDLYVDPNAYIDRRLFKTDEDLVKYLMSISEESWLAYRNAGRRYIESEQYKVFTPAYFASVLANVLMA